MSVNTIRYSVIVPAWQAENTLARCLDSLLAEDREDVEILLISDGATDGTDAIARHYGNRIRYFRQDHQGVSAARNLGLAMAVGEYITFVDSDDFVRPGYFARLDRMPDCDLLVFGVQHPPGKDPLAMLLATRQIMPPWNKRFRRGQIAGQNLRFLEDLDTGEDFCFCLAYALRARSLAVSPVNLYTADISNQQSLSRRYRPHLEETMLRVFRYTAGLEGARRYRHLLDRLCLRSVVSCIAEEYKKKPPSAARVREICASFRPLFTRPGAQWLLRYGAGWLWAVSFLGKGWKFWWKSKKC